MLFICMILQIELNKLLGKYACYQFVAYSIL